jgi:hypothetical protein
LWTYFLRPPPERRTGVPDECGIDGTGVTACVDDDGIECIIGADE